MNMKALINTASRVAGIAFTQSVTVWFREKGKSRLTKSAFCLAASLLLALSGSVHTEIEDNHYITRENLIIPATYEPIVVPVRITAYNPVSEQTDQTPFTMASGRTVYSGAVALSRDLESDLGLKFGDAIEIDGLGLFVFEDRMNRRWKRTVDILFFCPEKARRFGVQYGLLKIH